MSTEINIDSPDYFLDEDTLYQWLVNLHKENEVGSLESLLQFFLDNEREDYYLTVKKFIANELKK